MKRLLLFAIAFAVAVGLWFHFAKISCKVVGLSTALGPVHSTIEAPFFSNISSKSNTSLQCQYVPQNNQGINPNYLLRYLKRGFYDYAAIIFRQNESSDIAIVGMDIPGIPIDLVSSKMLTKDFLPFLDGIFEEKYQSKILAPFTIGRLELFCAKPVKNLTGFQNLRIRIATGQGSSVFALLTELGANPLTIEYGNTLKALQGKFIDCGISTYSSAKSAGWFEYLPYRMDLDLGNASSAYVINLKTWNVLSFRQKITLKNSIENLSNSISDYAEMHYEQSKLPCSPKDLSCFSESKLIAFNQSDLARINQISINSILRPWLKKCDDIHPGCKSEWLNAVKNIPSLEKLSLSDL